MHKIIKGIKKLTFILMLVTIQSHGNAQNKNWRVLDTIPDPYGFAGSYAGNLSTGIICAGGAQFENGTPPWNSGVKVWTDRIFYLSDENSSWKEIGKLPFKCGYGASASYKGKFYILYRGN